MPRAAQIARDLELRRRVFPFRLGRQARAAPAREGVGLVIADMHDGRVGLDRPQAGERHRMPGAADFAPVQRRIPFFAHDGLPTVREPMRRFAIAAGRHEFEPLGIGDQAIGQAIRFEQHAMARALVVEGKPVAVVPHFHDAAVEGDEFQRRGFAHHRGHERRIGGVRRILREGVQDVGQQQFLMLLLVIEPQLDQRHDLRLAGQRGRSKEIRHPGIDVAAVGGNLIGCWARDRAARRPRMPLADGLVIGVEQIIVARVAHAIAGDRICATGTSRRTTLCARGAIWPGSRPASTGRSDPRAKGAPPAPRSPHAPRESARRAGAAPARREEGAAKIGGETRPVASWSCSAGQGRPVRTVPLAQEQE